MSGNTNMRPTGYRSKFGTTAKTAWEYWNIYCFAIAIGFHSLVKDAVHEPGLKCPSATARSQ